MRTEYGNYDKVVAITERLLAAGRVNEAGMVKLQEGRPITEMQHPTMSVYVEPIGVPAPNEPGYRLHKWVSAEGWEDYRWDV